jgi:hypothetical protein
MRKVLATLAVLAFMGAAGVATYIATLPAWAYCARC